MLSNKTQELFARFLIGLKEDTGLEPESCMFSQYDHYGNTSEAKALQLVNDFNFTARKSDDNHWVRKEADKIGKCSLTFTYFYEPEEVEEEGPACDGCQKVVGYQLIEGLCEDCNEKVLQQEVKEQRQLEKEYYNSRL